MADLTYTDVNPITLQSMMQALPQIQAQQARVAKLRAAQQAFDEMKGQTNPHFLPTQMGGLYPTVAKWMPDYAGAANKIAGTIGGLWAGNQADQAGMDETRNSEILKAADALGRPRQSQDEASSTALRAYLGLIGGPDVKNIIGNTPHVAATKVAEDGEIINIMSDGTQVPTGRKADFKSNVVNIPGQVPMTVGTSGAGRGVISPVQPAGMQPMPQQPPAGQSLQNPAGSQSTDDIFRRMMGVENSTGDMNAVSPKGAYGPTQLMPATGSEMEKYLGLPPGATRTDRDANVAAGRTKFGQLVDKYNGNHGLAAMAYNWGPANVDSWLARGGDMNDPKIPKETHDYINRVFGNTPLNGDAGNVPIAGTGGSTGTGGVPRNPSYYERAAQGEQGKIDTQVANAPRTAAAQGLTTNARADATNRAKVAAALPQQEQQVQQTIDIINQLENHPGLKQITGSGLLARAPDSDKASTVMNALFANTPATAALALHQQVKGKAFLQAFNMLRGSGQISNMEGDKATAAMGRMSRAQSTKEYVKALEELKGILTSGLETNRRFANSGPTLGNQGAAPAPASDDGWSIEEVQ